MDYSMHRSFKHPLMVDKKKRMKLRKNKIGWLCYPEDDYRNYWDFYITLVLIFTCIETPLRISVLELEDRDSLHNWKIVSNFVDCMFFFDIILIFNTAYYDEDFVIIEDRK